MEIWFEAHILYIQTVLYLGLANMTNMQQSNKLLSNYYSNYVNVNVTVHSNTAAPQTKPWFITYIQLLFVSEDITTCLHQH